MALCGYEVCHLILQLWIIGKRSIGDVSGEQAMKEKEKEKEKDSRLQVHTAINCLSTFGSPHLFTFHANIMLSRLWRKLSRGRGRSIGRRGMTIGWRKQSAWRLRRQSWILLRMLIRWVWCSSLIKYLSILKQAIDLVMEELNVSSSHFN